MNNLMTLCVLLIQSLSIAGCHSSMLQGLQRNSSPPVAVISQPRRQEWRPAIYQGLVMGKSKRADLLRVLGKPKWSELFDEDKLNPAVWYHYEGVGELPGELVVYINKRDGTIEGMSLNLENFTKEEVLRHFGNGYKVTRYDFCKGYEEEESAPLYETPDGSLTYLEYRERGIAVVEEDTGKVKRIDYVSEPIGSSSPECPQPNR